MNKSYRIRTEVGTNANKHIKLKLDQEYDSFEILSLGIDQKDVYQNFNCDYGVVIGRVTANNGVSIPNAKVSIFVPISDEDKERPEIKAIYPYESPSQKNSEGKRYNLLPRVAQEQPDGTVRPQQPFGSFPTKQEFVTNDSWLEVYDTYYKYSSVTNQAGDFMLFGVPIGTQTVHMSVDITDIGRFSMSPATLVTNLGYSPNLFTDNGTRIKESSDLDDLPNIETQEISVDVIPFCGDSENFDIGITRQDFRIRAELVSTFTIFGTAFTDGDNDMWADDFDGGSRRVREYYRTRGGWSTPSIGTKRIGTITEKVYSINASVSDADIDSGNFDPTDPSQVTLLDSSQYTSFKRDGDFVFIVTCNRNKIITSEEGLDIPVANNFAGGAFTEFRGFVILEITEDELRMDFSEELGNNLRARPLRMRFKFPQSAPRGDTFNLDDADPNTIAWRKQNYKFEFNKYYSIAKFYGTIFNDNNDGSFGNDTKQGFDSGFSESDRLNRGGRDPFWNTGIIITEDVSDQTNNTIQQFPTNSNVDSGQESFGGTWMNFAVHFSQIGAATSGGGLDNIENFRSNTQLTINYKNNHFYLPNAQEIAGGDVNTIHLGRSDLHYTDFVEVPLQDIFIFQGSNRKGFNDQQLPDPLAGDYKNGNDPCPENGGLVGSLVGNPPDTNFYFYKGLETADCIDYLFDLGLI